MTQKINEQLRTFDNLMDTEISNFNKEFNQLKLNYLSIEE